MAHDIQIKKGALHVVSSGDPMNSNKASQGPICLNSCGYNYADNVDKPLTIYRPRGRLDYQILYIQQGALDFIINGTSTILKKGSLILYKPGEVQHYSHCSTEPSLSYWVHFTGTAIEELLRQNSLWENTVCQIGDEPVIAEIITRLVREMQFRSYQYTLMCTAYFLELICVLSRNLQRQFTPSITRYDVFIPAIEMMHKDYHIDRSIEYYAVLCGMSKCHFIRKFKEYTGMSPHSYLIRIRLNRAKDLLLSSNMTISEISFSVGYDNPLYFSRLFKKYTGSTPSEYR